MQARMKTLISSTARYGSSMNMVRLELIASVKIIRKLLTEARFLAQLQLEAKQTSWEHDVAHSPSGPVFIQSCAVHESCRYVIGELCVLLSAVKHEQLVGISCVRDDVSTLCWYFIAAHLLTETRRR